MRRGRKAEEKGGGGGIKWERGLGICKGKRVGGRRLSGGWDLGFLKEKSGGEENN